MQESCSVAQLRQTLCDPMDCSTLGFPVFQYLLELAQTHVHRVREAIQPSHPLLPPSSLALNLSVHQGLFQWVGTSQQVAKVLELQLQHSPSKECKNLGSFKLFLRFASSLSKDRYIANTERFLFSPQAHWDQRLQWLQTRFLQHRNCTQHLFFLYWGNWHLLWHKE